MVVVGLTVRHGDRLAVDSRCCGPKWKEERNFQLLVRKWRRRKVTLFLGPLASHLQERALRLDLPMLLSPDQALWPQHSGSV